MILKKGALIATLAICSNAALIAPKAIAEKTNNNGLSALMSDVVSQRICDNIKGKFRTLESEGQDGKTAVTGSLWLRDCSARSVPEKPDQFKVTMAGQGWRWLYREKEKLNAEFEVSEVVQFDVDISLTLGTTFQYDPQERRLTAWFVPQAEPQVKFTSTGDVEVDKEGLWATVLAGTASLALQSPDRKADQKLEEKGAKKLRDRFDDGISFAKDLCSGHTVTELAHRSKAELFKQLEQQPNYEKTNVVLHPNGLVLSGPYDADRAELSFKLGSPDGAIEASLLCYDDASHWAEAVASGKALPKTSHLARKSMTAGQKGTTLSVEGNTQCPVILALRSSDKKVRSSDKKESPVTSYYKVKKEQSPDAMFECTKS